jgi:hypothetical protein
MLLHVQLLMLLLPATAVVGMVSSACAIFRNFCIALLARDVTA